MIPVLEPSNQQECYDMAFWGFELSERYHVPVMIRLTTRLSHSRAGGSRRQILNQNPLNKPDDINQFMLLPAIARKKYKHLISLQDKFEQEALDSPFNSFKLEARDYSKGIITTGLGYNYLREAFKGEEIPYPVYKISQYPVPKNKIRELYSKCESLIVFEEGMPLMEELFKGFGLGMEKPVHGRLDGTIAMASSIQTKWLKLSVCLIPMAKTFPKCLPEDRPLSALAALTLIVSWLSMKL
jgi:indolepyruvate ferredoxin oxidoreductase alpha subunit